MMIEFFKTFQIIFSIALKLSNLPWWFFVVNQSFFWFLSKSTFFWKKRNVYKVVFRCKPIGFSISFQIYNFFWNKKLFVNWFLIGNKNLSFSEETFGYNQCKENESKIFKSCEKTSAGLPEKNFPRPQRGTNARAKNDIFWKKFR